MTGRDLNVFKMLATSYVLRGSWFWRKAEIQRRLNALDIVADATDSLRKICEVDWLNQSLGDFFELTELGRSEARAMMKPSTAGSR